MTQEFVTLPREVAERALKSMLDARCSVYDGFEYDKAATALAAAMQQTPAPDHPQNHVPDAGNMVPQPPLQPLTDEEIADGLHFAIENATQYERAAFRKGIKFSERSHGIGTAASAPNPPALKQPQANQPAMTPIAQRKLEDLMASGYTISGYSVYHEQKHQHGFVTGAGLVGWWKPEGVEYLQPQVEPSTVAFCHVGDVVVCDNDSLLRRLGVKRSDKLYLHPQDLNCKSKQALLATLWGYTKEQPKRPPLTDNQIDKIAESMPGGLEGFLKGWGWRQFARAVLENDHNIK